VRNDDFAGLRMLGELAGDRMRRGIVLYTGDEPVPFGPDLAAVPVHEVLADLPMSSATPSNGCSAC